MTDSFPDPIVHEPVNPSRDGIPGETAFLTAWQALMEEEDARDDDGEGGILTRSCEGGWAAPEPPNQEDATLAATMVQWLGTNAGAHFVHLARGLSGTGRLNSSEAHVAAWAVVNARKRPCSGGMRALESMMVPSSAPRSLDGCPRRIPRLTARHYELAEHLAAWLGSPEGERFVAEREREIALYGSHRHVAAREAMRAGHAPARTETSRGVAEYLAALREARVAA